MPRTVESNENPYYGEEHMRRLLITSIALAATATAAAALPATAGSQTPLKVTKVHATWLPSSHRIFVDTSWTPKRFQTRVTVKISVDGDSLRTLQAKNWVIGRKLFQLTLPDTVTTGSQARIDVRVQSDAGSARDHVTLELN
jgi:hypothetical protein